MKNIQNFEDFNVNNINELFGLFKKKDLKKDDNLAKWIIKRIKYSYSDDVFNYTTYPTIEFEVDFFTGEHEIENTNQIEIYSSIKLEEWKTGNDHGCSVWKLFFKERVYLEYRQLDVSGYLLDKLRKSLYKLKNGDYDRRNSID